MTQQALIELPAKQLLEKFGSGGHKPGSGSAAALMGILSCKLTLTVCKLSLAKEKYKSAHRQIDYIKQQIEERIEPKLQAIFQKDAEVFDAVIAARRARIASEDKEEQRKHRKEELAHLREATELPIEIGKLCLSLVDHGVYVFDKGFQGARGDSGAAVGAAIAAVTASAFITNLNLTSFGGSAWREDIVSQCQKMLTDLNDKQLEAFKRLTSLGLEEIKKLDVDFDEDLVKAPKLFTAEEVRERMTSAFEAMVASSAKQELGRGPKPRRKYS